MKSVYKNSVCLFSAWLMGRACTQPQHTSLSAEAMFRGDTQHRGVYTTKAVPMVVYDDDYLL